MASLSKDGNGTRRIQFIDGDGERRTIRLGNVPTKTAETVLRRVEELAAHRIAGTAPSADLAQWLAEVPLVFYSRLVRVGLAAPREERPAERRTLSQLVEKFLRNAVGKDSTRKVWQQCAASLRQFFGPTAMLEEITPERAEEFRAWLTKPHPIIVGRARTKVVKSLAVATQAKRLEVAKQIFGKAVRWGMVAANPFDGVRAGSKVNAARMFYVSREATTAILAACPSQEWQLIVALCRYAGLRCPSELIGLRWCDVNVPKRALLVRSPKTEHHGDAHASRFVPIGDELLALLELARGAAETLEERIVPSVANGDNLRTEFVRIVARAGLVGWEKPFQNLRSSCETDWLERFPGRIAAVAQWMGHSPVVAMRHYAQVLPGHFGDAAAAPTECAAVNEQSAPPDGGARSSPKAAHNAAQQLAEMGGIGRQSVWPDARISREMRGSPCDEGGRGSQEVGATRFEQLANIPAETLLQIFGGAESGAPAARPAAPPAAHSDPLLAVIVNAWPQLTAEHRLRILEIVATAATLEHGTPPSSRRHVTEARGDREKRTSVAADGWQELN
jgi:hypothetical protein